MAFPRSPNSSSIPSSNSSPRQPRAPASTPVHLADDDRYVSYVVSSRSVLVGEDRDRHRDPSSRGHVTPHFHHPPSSTSVSASSPTASVMGTMSGGLRPTHEVAPVPSSPFVGAVPETVSSTRARPSPSPTTKTTAMASSPAVASSPRDDNHHQHHQHQGAYHPSSASAPLRDRDAKGGGPGSSGPYQQQRSSGPSSRWFGSGRPAWAWHGPSPAPHVFGSGREPLHHVLTKIARDAGHLVEHHEGVYRDVCRRNDELARAWSRLETMWGWGERIDVTGTGLGGWRGHGAAPPGGRREGGSFLRPLHQVGTHHGRDPRVFSY